MDGGFADVETAQRRTVAAQLGPGPKHELLVELPRLPPPRSPPTRLGFSASVCRGPRSSGSGHPREAGGKRSSWASNSAATSSSEAGTWHSSTACASPQVPGCDRAGCAVPPPAPGGRASRHAALPPPPPPPTGLAARRRRGQRRQASFGGGPRNRPAQRIVELERPGRVAPDAKPAHEAVGQRILGQQLRQRLGADRRHHIAHGDRQQGIGELPCSGAGADDQDPPVGGHEVSSDPPESAARKPAGTLRTPTAAGSRKHGHQAQSSRGAGGADRRYGPRRLSSRD